MHEHPDRRLTLTGSDGSLAGTVTLDDLVVLLVAELDSLAGVIEN